MLLARRQCCCSCTYFSAVTSSPGVGQTTFQAALDNDLLVPQSGTWTIVSNRLRLTGPGAILIDVPHPDSLSRMRLQVNSSGGFGAVVPLNVGAVLRLSVDYIDDDNRHYVEGFLDSSSPYPTTGKIARVESGSETVLWDKQISMNNYASGGVFAVFCVQDNGVHFSTNSTGVYLSDPIPATTTAVGGLKAAIEVDQGPSDVYEFDWIILDKAGSPACPTPHCDSCMPAVQCEQIPAGGFLVTISGLAENTNPFVARCTSLTAFHASFVCDERTYYYREGTPSGCSGPAGGLFDAPRVAWRSAVFTLSPSVICNVFTLPSTTTYTYGRVILAPRHATVANCGTVFDVILQVSETDNDTCSSWRMVGMITPTIYSAHEVGYDCTALSGATFSGSASTTRINTTSAVVVVDAIP